MVSLTNKRQAARTTIHEHNTALVEGRVSPHTNREVAEAYSECLRDLLAEVKEAVHYLKQLPKSSPRRVRAIRLLEDFNKKSKDAFRKKTSLTKK